MRFLRFVVRRPVLVLMVFGALVLFGAYALTQLPVDQFPKIEPPVVTVVTVGSLLTDPAVLRPTRNI